MTTVFTLFDDKSPVTPNGPRTIIGTNFDQNANTTEPLRALKINFISQTPRRLWYSVGRAMSGVESFMYKGFADLRRERWFN